MKITGTVLLAVILVLITAPVNCSASIAGEADQPTLIELAEIFNHVFTVKVTGKIETTDRTYYTFNVTEYLKTPVNSSTLYMAVYGGSEIMVSPATTLYIGVDYLFFCDEINQEYSVTGLHYNYKPLSSIDATEMEHLRRTLMALKVATSDGAVATPETNIIDREREQPEEPNINPPSQRWSLDPETVKESRKQDNLLLALVYLCTAGIYLTLIPVMKNGLKR